MVAKMRVSFGLSSHVSIITATECGTSWRVSCKIFADQLGRQKALRLVGDVVRREVRRAFGQARHDGLPQRVQAFAGLRGDRNVVREVVQLRGTARSAAAATPCPSRGRSC